MAAPAQIMAADFQASELTNSFWLRKEITNVGWFAPFINTTGGERLKLDGLARAPFVRTPFGRASFGRTSASAEARAGSSFSSTATVWYETLAADHASGLVMPARVSAAAILACWLISRVLVGAAPPASLMICGEGSRSVKASGTGSRGESPSGESGRT